MVLLNHATFASPSTKDFTNLPAKNEISLAKPLSVHVICVHEFSRAKKEGQHLPW